MKNGKRLWLSTILTCFVIGIVSLPSLLLTNQSSVQFWSDPIDDFIGGSIYDETTHTFQHFDAPAFLDIMEVSLDVPTQGIFQVGLKVAQHIPLYSQDRFCFDFLL